MAKARIDGLAASNDCRSRTAERTGDYMFGAHRAFGQIAVRIDAVVSPFTAEAFRIEVVYASGKDSIDSAERLLASEVRAAFAFDDDSSRTCGTTAHFGNQLCLVWLSIKLDRLTR